MAVRQILHVKNHSDFFVKMFFFNYVQFLIAHNSQITMISLEVVWQYRLWSFTFGDTKFIRLLTKIKSEVIKIIIWYILQ